MSDEPIGPALDALGITWPRDEGDVITDAVIIVKYLNHEGESRVMNLRSEGSDMIVTTGLVALLAQLYEANSRSYWRED